MTNSLQTDQFDQVIRLGNVPEDCDTYSVHYSTDETGKQVSIKVQHPGTWFDLHYPLWKRNFSHWAEYDYEGKPAVMEGYKLTDDQIETIITDGKVSEDFIKWLELEFEFNASKGSLVCWDESNKLLGVHFHYDEY